MKLKCIGGCAAGTWVDLDADREGVNIQREIKMLGEISQCPIDNSLAISNDFSYEYYKKMEFRGNSCSYFVLVPEGMTADRALWNLIVGYKKKG